MKNGQALRHRAETGGVEDGAETSGGAGGGQRSWFKVQIPPIRDVRHLRVLGSIQNPAEFFTRDVELADQELREERVRVKDAALGVTRTSVREQGSSCSPLGVGAGWRRESRSWRMARSSLSICLPIPATWSTVS